MLEHLIEEAEIYMEVLEALINKEIPKKTTCGELNFWNHIMAEHAEFIDGMLDPTEGELKDAAKVFTDRFEKLVKECVDDASSKIIKKSLEATTEIRDYKKTATEGLLECKIKSIIPPILADHVLREANHYIRILKNRK
jgi:hypothetical protein